MTWKEMFKQEFTIEKLKEALWAVSMPVLLIAMVLCWAFFGA